MQLKRWLWLSLLLGGGALHLFPIRSGHAHTVSACVSANCCSPHGATESNMDSKFSNCVRGGSDYQRDFYCTKGTACAVKLCNSYSKIACGESSSNGTTSHGKSGGHSPSISWYGCASGFPCPGW